VSGSPALRIAIVGAGKIGSIFAFQLARTGHHDVTVVARPGSARLAQLRRDGGIVSIRGERAEVRVLDAIDEETAYDLVIVTLLTHQVDAVLPALQRSAAACIQFMANTFEPERLQAALGDARCALGMAFVQANFDKDGKLDATIGAGGQKTLISRQLSVDLFNAAGLPSRLEPDMTLWLRCHVPFCVALESASVSGERRGGGATWRQAVVLARGVHESFALIRGLGYRIYPRLKARIDASPVWVVAAILWGLSRLKSFRELLATGEQECRALVDAMVAASARSTLPVTVAKIRAMAPS
jgi:2-dehydropantoate 2-reductase